jgi:uncharacterized protein (TIGR03086 family)
MSQLGPIDLFERASARAMVVADGVRPDQLDRPTPCAEWSVQQLLDHLAFGPSFLRGLTLGAPIDPPAGATAADYRVGRGLCLGALHECDDLGKTTPSPFGFDWTVLEATAGTFMDTLVHTWDLATATGQPATLDADLVDACVAMFIPEMPERGRAAGLVGPAVDVGADASPQDRLLGAMGRRP